ncbi:MAG TPA: rod shape-determining protein MreC [Patescibacteria group bacterium]|nr:rod shape-determining protein MreC [Patescibacteria group bacterium]
MLNTHRWFFVIGVVIAALLMLLGGLFRPFSNLLQRAALPLVRLASAAFTPAANSISELSSQKKKEADLTDLEKRISSLALDYTKLQSLEEENASLRAQAKFLKTTGYDSVGARVISRKIDDQHATLLIDRGLNDTLEIGEAVVTDNGIYIGKISAIQERIATVLLTSDPSSRVAAAIAGQNKLIGVLEGRGTGATVLTFIPSSENLKRDQIVVTSGTEQKIPGHLPIGIINDVQGKPTDPFLNAAVEPLLSGDRVLFVSVLRPTVLGPSL